jgi:YggT family protein
LRDDFLAAEPLYRHIGRPLEWAVGSSFLSYWYFHLPNFVLAALMYTLLGRAVLGVIVQPESSNYIWRFFCRITDPVVAAVSLVTPKATPPVVVWLFGVVWLFWLRVMLLHGLLFLGAAPRFA